MSALPISYFIKQVNNPTQSFKYSYGKKEDLKPGTKDSYKRYLEAFEEKYPGKLMEFLSDPKNFKSEDEDPLELATKNFDNFVQKNKIENIKYPGKSRGGQTKDLRAKIKDVRSAFRLLARIYLTFVDGNYAMDLNTLIEPKVLAEMIASTAIFASKKVVTDVVNKKLVINKKHLEGKEKQRLKEEKNVYASWNHCTTRRDTDKENRDNKVTTKGLDDTNYITVFPDDNTSANHAIKEAILFGINDKRKQFNLFHNYTACHIWGLTDDNRAFCSLVNLVLIPNAIYGLSDHHPFIQKILQRRSQALFGEIEGIKFPYQYSNKVQMANLTPEEEKIYNQLKWRTI